MTALELADALEATPDCTCYASSYTECGCDAIWPEQWITQAACKLRSLHAQRDALREALTEIVAAADGSGWDQLDASFSKARAAIKAAEENT